MTEQRQIEEMAVIGCVRNPQAHTAEECAKCEFKEGCCNAYRHAKALYDTGHRKVPENAVILTLEERDKEMKEIARLNRVEFELLELNMKYYNEVKNLRQEVAELKAQNERLKEVIAEQNELCWNCKKSVKEFAEKLKKRLNLGLYEWQYAEVDSKTIDEILKEYIDEE